MRRLDADVYLFRKTVLGGRTISSAGPGARRIPSGTRLANGDLWVLGYPVTDHTAKLDQERIWCRKDRYRATIFVDPPGITVRAEMVTWAGTSQTAQQRLVKLEYPDEEGKVRFVEAWGTSLLGELRKVGEKLSERYRWQPAQAVWFLLSGEIPAVPALTVTRSFPSSMYHLDALITVEASPYVSSKTVEKAFRKAQIKSLGSSGGRRPGEGLRLLRFVMERIEPLGMEELGSRGGERGLLEPRRVCGSSSW